MSDIIVAITQLRQTGSDLVAKSLEQDRALQSQTEMGMQLRKEVFAARSDLAAGMSGANDAAQAAAMAQMAVQIENKFFELDKITQNLGNAVEMLGLREQRVEEVVSHQVAGQPQHEQVISGAFQQLDAKISHVASMAKKFDGTQVTIGAFASVPFTQAMKLDMKSLREEFAEVKTKLDELPGHIDAELIRVCQPLGTKIAAEGAAGIAALEYISTRGEDGHD